MRLWDWLFGKPKGTEDGFMARIAPPKPPPPVPEAPASEPNMTNIRVSAPSAVRPVFSIQTAIELMRTLPVDENPELVLRVVRKTLRSTGVDVEEVIKSAQNQEEAIVGGIATDRAAIELLEQQITLRKANIERLELELDETRKVRGRLEEAMENETKIGPVLPPEDILRIRAEAEAKAAKAAGSASAPTPSGPPPAPKKPVPPKLPSFPPLPSKRSGPPPAPKPKEAAADTSAEAREESTSVPDVSEIDDAFAETTAKVDVAEVKPRKPSDEP